MPRKQRSDKIESSEDKIKHLSLFFLQGTQLRLEGLGDADNPKIDIITLDGEEKKHVSVPLHKVGDSAYEFTIPDIFKRDGAEKYLICDQLFYVDSFTKDDHIAWETWSEEQKLSENFAQQTTVRRGIRSAVPTDDEIDSVRQEIPGLEEVRQALLKKQKAAFTDLDLDDDAVTKVVARLKLTNTRLKELRAQLYVWENESDPLDIAKKTQPMAKDLATLEAEVNRVFMTFVHDYATRNEMTTLSLEEWLEQADEQDYSNAIQWVAESNARKMLGRIAKPLTREDERKRKLAKLLN